MLIYDLGIKQILFCCIIFHYFINILNFPLYNKFINLLNQNVIKIIFISFQLYILTQNPLVSIILPIVYYSIKQYLNNYNNITSNNNQNLENPIKIYESFIF